MLAERMTVGSTQGMDERDVCENLATVKKCVTDRVTQLLQSILPNAGASMYTVPDVKVGQNFFVWRYDDFSTSGHFFLFGCTYFLRDGQT
jgi:hypothetical protein